MLDPGNNRLSTSSPLIPTPTFLPETKPSVLSFNTSPKKELFCFVLFKIIWTDGVWFSGGVVEITIFFICIIVKVVLTGCTAELLERLIIASAWLFLYKSIIYGS